MPKQDIAEGLEVYRFEAIRAAKQLSYKREFVERIQHADTINEISRIMVTARKDKFGS
jgi:hypothetical protein